MGISNASCFKFIACGGDSVEYEDLQAAESKDSSDRRGWSFRKRSARHRVLSNTVISGASLSTNKENSDTAVINFPVQPNLNVPEKTLVTNGTVDKVELSPQLDSKSSDTIAAKEDECGDATYNESGIIIIQAAIRGWLAQQVLLKQKNIIKLQAAVRGHIVRRYAVGMLRCALAIIKIQTLVRARQTCLVLERPSDSAKHGQSCGKNKTDSALLGIKKAKPNGTYTYVSIERLLSNAFARQLMESTPRPTNIKCEPLKSDTAWKWLERWMSVSLVTIEEPMESGSAAEQHEEEHSDCRNSISVPSECYTEPTDSSSGVAASTEASKNDNSLVNYDANNSGSHSFTSLSPSSSHLKLHSMGPSDSTFNGTESNDLKIKETEMIEDIEGKPLSKEVKVGKSLTKEEETNELDGSGSKKVSTEKAETEVKKFSRKASNPAFVAAQSKFEELSSAVAPVKLSAPSVHDTRVESSLEKFSSATDQPLRSRDDGLADNTFSNASAVQLGGSEYGMVLSVSSTLDSPERLEAGVIDVEQDAKVSDENTYHRSAESLGLANGNSMTPEADWSCTNSTKLERDESINSCTGEYSTTAIGSPQPEMIPEADPANLQSGLGCEESHPVDTSAPKVLHIGHINVPESQATPSTLVSVKPKKNKGEKSGSNRNNKSLSADKNSLSNRNQDAASKSSLEHLHEHRTGKKRYCTGSEKPDHGELDEPRECSSNNTLPSYMQATESARAKAIANSSPRSSPDLHDKDIHIKKRHSLPGLNERQRSPRAQRSVSHAQQNVKGNGTLSPQERKWRR